MSILPPLYIECHALFHGEQLGSGKAMKLMVSRAVARAAVNLSVDFDLLREVRASSSQSSGRISGRSRVLPFVADGIDH